MMKVWNMVLVSGTFFLCIFGTFLTRSGVVSSVHAFAQSSIGKWFVGFLAIVIAGTLYLILDRLDYLKTEARLESVISRESSFMFNNLILVAACFAILWGTLFPVISEWATGEKISVGAPFFNRINIPIGPQARMRSGRFSSIALISASVTNPLSPHVPSSVVTISFIPLIIGSFIGAVVSQFVAAP